jgi:hypothetical protein
MTKREITIGAAMLAVGLIVGSTKGDDLLEVVQGVETIEVNLDDNKEIAERFNLKIRHQLWSTIPPHLNGAKLGSKMDILPNGYHFELISGGAVVAVLDFDLKEEFTGGGWIVD